MIVKLHQLNNPSELELVDSTDIANVDEFNGHSAILTHMGMTKYVAETPEEVYNLLIQ